MSGIALESRKNIAWKAMTAFQSQGNKNFNILARAYNDWRSGKITGAQCLGKMSTVAVGNALAIMAINAVFQGAMRGLGGDDDKDKNKKWTNAEYVKSATYSLLKENLGSFYGGTNFAVPALNVLNAALNEKPMLHAMNDTVLGSSVENAFKGSGDLVKAAKQLYEGDKKSRVTMVKSIDEMARGLLPLFGIPVLPGTVISKFFRRFV
jgi:hypothetical protein